jgi:AhpD family alkylhydroperoxidase
MKNNFDKKIFTPGLFLNDTGFLLLRIPPIISALRNKQISKAFAEKIMTVTTAVNGCTYCTWFHAKQALASGISEEEVKNMLNLQFQANASDYETMALLYAQHFAETNRKPEDEMTRKFIDFYDKKTAGHLYLFIRLINFGNLYGNTWDAVLSRFNGQPAKKSNVFFELLFFLSSFWFMLPIMALSKYNL